MVIGFYSRTSLFATNNPGHVPVRTAPETLTPDVGRFCCDLFKACKSLGNPWFSVTAFSLPHVLSGLWSVPCGQVQRPPPCTFSQACLSPVLSEDFRLQAPLLGAVLAVLGLSFTLGLLIPTGSLVWGISAKKQSGLSCFCCYSDSLTGVLYFSCSQKQVQVEID